MGAVTSYTFTNVTANHTISAAFAATNTSYTLTMTKAGTGGGTVTNSPSGTSFAAGTVVTLTAAPDANSTFAGWSGGCSGNTTTATVTMNSNVTATATFNPKAGNDIWPNTTAPVTADSGPDGAVELGVKFRSDTAGNISGIRFYKASTNTGTHVGNLWTSTGTLLATATFTNETASGWQQVNFATPVAIAANTVYVASYHANSGHYSCDQNYFASTGVDAPPLHLLANGVSGNNGVYAYGSSSVFPSQGWNSSNYWVDVVFTPSGPAPTLTSIAVTPVNQTIPLGSTQSFTATGTYSDSSTQNITSSVTWASSNTNVATITAAGIATAVASGSTTISATQGGITGSTTLNVQAAALSITTTSLAGGAVNVAYSATLAASGGTLPYTWSIVSGSLPGGLTLNSGTGVISGTPTATGTFSFTVQVTDNSSPGQTATKALSITVSAQQTSYTIWAATTVPGVVDAGPDSAVELGVKFRSDVNGYITGIRFYKASTNTGTHVGNLSSSTGALLATATFANETASGWQQVNFTTPVAITANTVYVASYHTTTGHYSYDLNYFTGTGVDAPPLHALADGGVYSYGSTSNFPNSAWNGSNYWVDPVFQSQ